MQNVSTKFTQLFESNEARLEKKLVINNVEYLEDNILSISTNQQLFNTISIGNVIASSIEIRLNDVDSTTIPKASEIKLYIRYVSETEQSEWLLKGIYYINTRSVDTISGVISISGLDCLMKAEQPYDGNVSTFTQLFNYISDKIGAKGIIDNGNLLSFADSQGYSISAEYLTEKTCRDILSQVATCLGCNITINAEGYIKLLPLIVPNVGIYDAGLNAASVQDYGSQGTFSKVIVHYTQVIVHPPETDEEGNVTEGTTETVDGVWEAGNDSGLTLEVTIPFATQQMTNNLLARVSSYNYHPYNATSVRLHPAMEIGDKVRIGSGEAESPLSPITADIYDMSISYSATYSANISNPFQQELDSEFGYKNTIQNAITTAVNSGLVGTNSKISAEKVARETAIQALSQQIAAAGGLFTITEGTATTGYKYYLMDAAEKEKAKVVIQITANGMAGTNEGFKKDAQGQYYFDPKWGFNFVTGDAIVNTIYAGAEWVEELFATDVTATNLTVSGNSKLENITGTNLTINGNSNFSGTLNGVNGSFKGTLSADTFYLRCNIGDGYAYIDGRGEAGIGGKMYPNVEIGTSSGTYARVYQNFVDISAPYVMIDNLKPTGDVYYQYCDSYFNSGHGIRASDGLSSTGSGWMIRSDPNNYQVNLGNNADNTRIYGSTIYIGGTSNNSTVYINGKTLENSHTHSKYLTSSNSGNVTFNGTVYLNGSVSAKGIRGRSSTASANIRLQDGDNAWLALISSSSKRYKREIADLSDTGELSAERLYNIPVRQYKYNNDYLLEDDQRYDTTVCGFVVEDMFDVYPIAVELDEQGRPENWNERYIIPPMLKLIQKQEKKIAELEKRLEALESRLNNV